MLALTLKVSWQNLIFLNLEEEIQDVKGPSNMGYSLKKT